MPLLLDNEKYMQELIAHIISRENVYDYFYCDSEELVTIGIGHLVDAKNKVQAEHEALRFTREHFTHLKTTTGVPVASIEDVVADWRRVKEFGQKHKNSKARRYTDVAKLRLPSEGVYKLLRKKLSLSS